MRIFLLPISTRRALIYCQRAGEKPTSELSYVDRATNKAAETWAKWESSDKGWQKRTVEYGNRALQRIPYQEWGLKSFPPLNAKVQTDEMDKNKKFQVHYPGNVINQDDVPKVMARLASERKQLHYSRFVWSLIGIPFTIPFGLIPILPNIPFFFLSYRCWSHWRALKGSDHLDFILDHRLFQPVSSPQMESLFSKVSSKPQKGFEFVTRSQIVEGSDPEEHMILGQTSHKLVASTLNVPELALEVERAVWQVEKSLRRERKLEEERRHKQSTNEQQDRTRK